MKARNRTRKQNPAQRAFNNEYRGTLKRLVSPKTSDPNPPDYAGTCTMDGTSYWIAGWINREGPRPALDLVFQVAMEGKQSMRKPEDLRLRTGKRERPTQDELDWAHYAQTTEQHREGGDCERCNRVRKQLDAQFGADAPY